MNPPGLWSKKTLFTVKEEEKILSAGLKLRVRVIYTTNISCYVHVTLRHIKSLP